MCKRRSVTLSPELRRLLGTSIKAGGVGGEFFPLSMIGAGIGAVIQGIAPHADPTLFPILGIAGVFAAAFRAPLTAAAFIAETTGSIVYLVPGLIAAVTANAVMGRHSLLSVQVLHPYARSVIVSRAQIGELIAASPAPQSFSAETSLEVCAHQLADAAAYVVADGKVVGVVTRSALLRVPFTDYPSRKVADIEDRSPPRFDVSTQRNEAAAVLTDAKHDAIVVERDGQPVGILVEADLVSDT